jgi:predicted AAA+ superfamily ATPase
MELAAHDHRIFYYDNRQRGEVDFLVDDYQRLSVLPIEVKSGKDYKRHSAVSRMVSTDDYHIERAIVFSNSRDVETAGRIVYMPIYYVMFVSSEAPAEILL